MFLKGQSPFPRRGPRGSMLVVALWMIAVLTLLSFSLSQHVRQKIALADRIDRRNWLCGIAETGVYHTLYRIRQMKEANVGYFTLSDSYTSGEGNFSHVSAGEGDFSVGYPYLDPVSGKMKMHYGVEDEEGKVNINLLDAKTLAGFFQVITGLEQDEAEEIAYSIVDWRDTDNSMSHPDYEAEDDYYEDLSPPYESKDQLFESIEELLLVRGVTPEIYEKMRPFVTIYGSGVININTAPREVLMGLGIDEPLADKFLYYRSGPDGVEGTADDGTFMAAGNTATEFMQRVKISQNEINLINQLELKGVIGVNSTHFRIRSYGELPRKEQVLEIEAVADIEGKVLSWSVGLPGPIASAGRDREKTLTSRG